VSDTTKDAFLNGRLTIKQPKQGYRAATDPVFLAAFVPAKPGQSVLELGCGVATASLCLSARVGDLELCGIEIQAQYAALARENVTHNAVQMEVVVGDVTDLPAKLRAVSFDHVIANPPFFETHAHTGSADIGRDIAHRAVDPVSWIAHGLKRLKPGGWMTLIQRSHHLPKLLVDLERGAGDITILPLASRIGRPSERVLVRARKGAKGQLALLPPLIVHAGDKHLDGPQGYSPRAEAILRSGEPLEF